MTKTSKKILLLILISILTIFAFNAKTFAYVSNKQEAIAWFKDSNNFKDKSSFCWPKICCSNK